MTTPTHNFDRLFGANPDAIFVTRHSTGEVIYQNRAARTLVGNRWEKLPPQDRSETVDGDRNAIPAYFASIDHPEEGEIGIALVYCGLPTIDDDVVYFMGIRADSTASKASGCPESGPNGIPMEFNVFNSRELLQRVGENTDIAEEVIHNIRESLPEHIDRCRIAFERGNLTELRHVSHTINGSAGTAGAEVVADRARQLNRLLRRGITDGDTIESFLAELERAVERFLEAVSRNDLFKER